MNNEDKIINLLSKQAEINKEVKKLLDSSAPKPVQEKLIKLLKGFEDDLEELKN